MQYKTVSGIHQDNQLGLLKNAADAHQSFQLSRSTEPSLSISEQLRPNRGMIDDVGQLVT